MAMFNLTDGYKSLGLGSLYKNHKKKDGNAESEQGDVSVQSTEDEIQNLDSFLSSHSSSSSEQRVPRGKVFFKVNGTSLYGEKNKAIRGDEVPLFQGATLDLTSASLMGEKRFFKPPEAHGGGGLLKVFPDELNTAAFFPMQSLSLSETQTSGVATLASGVGFGTFNKIQAQKVELSNDKIVLKDGVLVNNIVNVSSEEFMKVPIGDIIIDETGIKSAILSSSDMCNFLNFRPEDYPDLNPPSPEEVEEEVAEEVAEEIITTGDVGVVEREEDPATTEQPAPTEETPAAEEQAGDEEGGELGILGEIIEAYKEKVTEAMEENGVGAQATELFEQVKSGEVGIVNAAKEVIPIAKEVKTDAIATGIEATKAFAEDSGMTKEAILEAWNDSKKHGNVDKDSEITKEIENKASVELGASVGVSFQVAPFVTFNVGAEASFEAGYEDGGTQYGGPTINLADKKLDGLDSLEVSRGISAQAKGSASLTVGVGAGVANVVEVVGKLMASLDASTGVDVIVKATAGFSGGHFQLKTVELDGTTTADLFASLSGGVSLNFFIWEQELYQKTFISKKIAEIEGGVKAIRGFETGKEGWTFEKSMSGSFLDGAYSVGKDADKLKALLGDDPGSTEHRFQNSVENFEKIKADLEKAREIIQVYREQSNKGVPTATFISDEGPKKIAGLVQQTEDNFNLQFINVTNDIECCLKDLIELQNNSEYKKVNAKNAAFEEYQKSLDIAKTKLSSDNQDEVNEGQDMIKTLQAKIKKDKFIKTSITNAATLKAVDDLKDKDTLMEYERNRTEELSLPFYKAKVEARMKAGEFQLENDEQSAALYGYYKSSRKKNLAKHFVQEIAKKDDLLKYFVNKTAKKQGSSINAHVKRIQEITGDYDKLTEAEKDTASKTFYEAYLKTGFFVHGINNTQYNISNISQFKMFINHYLKEKDALKYIERKKSYQDAMNERDKDGASEADANSAKDVIKIAKEKALDKDKSNLHMFATAEDLKYSTQKIAAVRQLEKNKASKTKRTKLVTVASQVQDKLLADDDGIDKLIAFENAKKSPNTKVIDELNKQKGIIKENTHNENDKLTSVQIDELTNNRYQAKKKALDDYFNKGSTSKSVSSAVREDFNVEAFYSPEEISALAGGEGSSENSTFETLAGISDSDDLKANKKLLTSRITGNVDDDRMLSYYDYKSREKENIAVNFYNMAENNIEYNAILTELKNAENNKLFDEFKDYLKKNSASFITPRQIMLHELSRKENYENAYNDQVDMVLDNKLDTLARDENGIAYTKDAIKKDDNTISLNQIIKIETEEEMIATETHRKRIEMLEKEGTAGYEGKRFKLENKDIRSRRDDLMNDPKQLQDILASVVKTDKDENDPDYNTYKEGRENLENHLKSYVKQQETCKIIKTNAQSILNNPGSILDDEGFASGDIVSLLEDQNKATEKVEATKEAVTAISSQASKIIDEPEEVSEAEETAQNNKLIRELVKKANETNAS